MKRRAIILGDVAGQLSTNLDMEKVCNYLLSLNGGAWLPSEISKKANISRNELDQLLLDTKRGNYDYVFLYFSGHGGYNRGTVIELNPQEETIREQSLSNLASRQLCIYDCCRTLPKSQIDKVASAMNNFSESASLVGEHARLLFDERIMNAYEQQMSLYSCGINECSYDFGEGGIYTKHLIDAANTCEDEYILAATAHSTAFIPTVVEAQRHSKEQTPDFFMAKLPSRYQLIIGLGAGCFKGGL